MSVQDQPNQARFTLSNADGVLTVTGKLHMNPTVATSLADEASALTTVTADSAGNLTWVTVITPNSAIVSSDNTVGGIFQNSVSPFQG